jgi:hypothetical protein
VLGEGCQAAIEGRVLVSGVKGQREFLPVLRRRKLDDPFDDVAGVLVAGEGDEVVKEDLLDQRLILL